MIEGAFSSDENMLCIKFNGWQFQGFEDAKIAVIEGIVTELIASRSLMTIASEEVKNIIRRIDWLKAAKKAGGLPRVEGHQSVALSRLIWDTMSVAGNAAQLGLSAKPKPTQGDLPKKR